MIRYCDLPDFEDVFQTDHLRPKNLVMYTVTKHVINCEHKVVFARTGRCMLCDKKVDCFPKGEPFTITERKIVLP